MLELSLGHFLVDPVIAFVYVAGAAVAPFCGYGWHPLKSVGRAGQSSGYKSPGFPPFLPLDEAIASRAVFVIVSGSDGRVETLLEPAK